MVDAGEQYSIIEPYVVSVNTPARVFAGRKDGKCLKFVDRDEWLELGIEVEEVE